MEVHNLSSSVSYSQSCCGFGLWTSSNQTFFNSMRTGLLKPTFSTASGVVLNQWGILNPKHWKAEDQHKTSDWIFKNSI